jgi:hypothetical protein
VLFGEGSGTSRRERLSLKRTRRMAAFTCNLHVLASRVTTDFSTVFLARGNFAKTWDMRTLRCLQIEHFEVLSFLYHLPTSDH